eukprot:scaffold3853_cov147-Chaetoceros_neogracile.AAC.1
MNQNAEEQVKIPCKTRTSAKEAVSSRWATRAAQQTTRKQQQQKPLQLSNNPQPTNSLCQTWKQVQFAIGFPLLRHLANAQKLHRPKSVPARTRTRIRIKKEPEKEKLAKNKEQLANTLTNIRVSTALQNRLAEITNGESKNYLKSVLSILPAGFDETSALTSSIQNRKRAFMLLDLGRVIRAHAQFITFACGGFGDLNAGELPPTHKLRRMGQKGHNNVGRKRKGVYIQPQFKVMKNPSLELLKLLTRLGVDLRCNSCDDVLAAYQAVNEERNERDGDSDEDAADAADEIGEEAMTLVDDVSKTRKPNGYFRRLLRAQHSGNCISRVEIAVDGVDEVYRISDTVRTFASRHNLTTNSDGCRFILRLPVMGAIGTSDEMEKGTWEKLVLSVHAAALKENGNLVGVSVDLSPWSNSLSSQGTSKESEQILVNLCTHLRLFRLLLLSVGQYHIRIDLTGLPHPFTREKSDLLTHGLKNMICSNVELEELGQLHDTDANKSIANLEELQLLVNIVNDPSTSSLFFTADVSDLLVQRAGALCCRVIGVKDGKGMAQEGKEDDIVEGAVAKHFYIDDGCYGSLGSTKCGSDNDFQIVCDTDKDGAVATVATNQHLPVPLYGEQIARKTHLVLHKKVSKSSDMLPPDDTNKSSNLVLSTVWGPTCDGLDKVCDKILLPVDLKANRDWLVFSNLGCGGYAGGLGLGTAFNGFDPPDVAYCVLGYFASVE